MAISRAAQTDVLQNAHYRLARYYLNTLSHASVLMNRGHENRAHSLQMVERDWAQIKHWQSWSVAWSAQDLERARLCVSFAMQSSEIILVRLAPEEVIRWAKQALAAAEAIHDDAAVRTMLFRIAHAYFWMGDNDGAAAYAERLQQNAADETLSHARAEYVFGTVALNRGQFAESEAHFLKSLELFGTSENEVEYGRVLQSLAYFASFRGDQARAIELLTRYVTILESTEREGELGVALSTIAQVLNFSGQYQSARDYALRGVRVCRKVSFARALPAALCCLADSQMGLEQIEAAREHYDEALKFARDQNLRAIVVHCLMQIGHTELRLDHDQEAVFERWQQSLALAREAHLSMYVFQILHDMALVHLLNQHIDAASGMFSEIAQAATALNTDLFSVRLIALAIVFAARTGQPERAATWLGLVAQYPNHQVYLEKQTLASLQSELEKALGHDHYESLLAAGKSLELSAVRDEVAALFKGETA
jgi:tetratricopeptide (TPR) repeat protein